MGAIAAPRAVLAIARPSFGGDRRASAHGTAHFQDVGGCEFFTAIAVPQVPQAIELLGGILGEDVFDLLHQDWIGGRSYALDETVFDGVISIDVPGAAEDALCCVRRSTLY